MWKRQKSNTVDDSANRFMCFVFQTHHFVHTSPLGSAILCRQGDAFKELSKTATQKHLNVT